MSTASIGLSPRIDAMYKSAYINKAIRTSPHAFEALKNVALTVTSVAFAALFAYPVCAVSIALTGFTFTVNYLGSLALMTAVFDIFLRFANNKHHWFDIRAAALILEPKDTSLNLAFFSQFSPYHLNKSAPESGQTPSTSTVTESAAAAPAKTVQANVPSQRAVVIGMNYEVVRAGQFKLQNCHNDARHITELLGRTGSRPEDITLMLDLPENQGKEVFPSKANIINQLKAAIADVNSAVKVNPNAMLYVHDSGHGTRTPEKVKGSEHDAMDDDMVAADFEFLSDDELKKIVKGLTPNASGLFTFDCCHSGTMLDLPNNYRFDTAVGKDAIKSAEGGDEMDYGSVILISGCLDTQTSADGGAIHGQGSGAMTAAYYSTLEEHGYQLTWRELLIGMNQKMRASGLKQNPQLSSSRKLDLDSYVATSEIRFHPQIKAK